MVPPSNIDDGIGQLQLFDMIVYFFFLFDFRTHLQVHGVFCLVDNPACNFWPDRLEIGARRGDGESTNLIAQPHDPSRRANRDETAGDKPLDSSSFCGRRNSVLNVLIRRSDTADYNIHPVQSNGQLIFRCRQITLSDLHTFLLEFDELRFSD